MEDLCSFNKEELKQWFLAKGHRPFLSTQVLDWVYKKGSTSFEEMTNLKKELRQELEECLYFPTLEKVSEQKSSDNQTTKTLWKLRCGSFVESVLIEAPDRQTLCVSSQVGCPARCAFCASGKEGLQRNLECAEIVEQVLLTQSSLAKKGLKLTNIVFMGMGEPLENYSNVVKAISLLCDEELFNFSKRRITVSTVGVVEGIYRLAESDLKVNLVLSLHAPNQKIRQKIIPYARKYDLNDILKAMDVYAAKTKRDLTFEYTLIAGINDKIEHAHELADLLKDRQCTVNLIPYNPVLGLRLQKPKMEVVQAFQAALEERNIITTCRYTKGDDIAAACGQLALQKKIDEQTAL
jgi:23S rRNA (adenine2503-C2)-methyltransferase